MKPKVFIASIIYLCFAVFTLSAATASAATLTAGQGEAAPGAKDIVIPVTLSSEKGEDVSSLNLDLDFDSAKFSFKQIAIGQAALSAGKDISLSTLAAGKLRMVITALNKNVIADGVVANISFDIAKEAVSGDSVLTISKAIAADKDARKVGLATSDGKITISAGKLKGPRRQRYFRN